jgi:hypothetical protein
MNKKAKRTETDEQIIYGNPETVSEQLHKYGTYEIQPTQDSDNEFPTIAQGLPKRKKGE